MSWQPYIDNNLVGTGKIAQAAIFGHDGGLWAKSPDFNVTKEEVLDIVKGFSDNSKLFAEGIRVGGTKFMINQATDVFIFGKYKVPSEENKTTNSNPLKLSTLMCAKTSQGVIIAATDESVPAESARPIVEKLADYLISVKF